MTVATPFPAIAPIGTFKDPKSGLEVPIRMHPQVSTWLQSVQNAVRPLGNNGPTANRPVGTSQVPLYIGQDFFDTSLGYKVTVASLNPTVWVNGAGAHV